MSVTTARHTCADPVGHWPEHHTERLTRCHYIKAHTDEQCTAEAVDPGADLLLCSKHLARAMQLIQQGESQWTPSTPTPSSS